MPGIILDNGDSSKNKNGEKSLLSGRVHSSREYDCSSEPGYGQFPNQTLWLWPRSGGSGQSRPSPEGPSSGPLKNNLSKSFWEEPQRWDRATQMSPVWWQFFIAMVTTFLSIPLHCCIRTLTGQCEFMYKHMRFSKAWLEWKKTLICVLSFLRHTVFRLIIKPICTGL